MLHFRGINLLKIFSCFREFNHVISSVAQSCLTLCDPMDCSMPGFPVHHSSWSLLKLMSIESVMPSNHLILCHPLLLPLLFPGIRVFSNESVLSIRWPKYWSFSISPYYEYSGLISFSLGLTGLISSLTKGVSRVYFNTTVQKHQFFWHSIFFMVQLTSIHDYWKNSFNYMDLCQQSNVSAF